MNEENLYNLEHVAAMFDRMSQTYGFANLLVSIGFTKTWRRMCVKQLGELPIHAVGYDLMCGMGEAWESLDANYTDISVTAIDISPVMVTKSKTAIARHEHLHIEVLQADVLTTKLAQKEADFLVSTFGLKTFDQEQQFRLAGRVAELLKPGGRFSFIEISDPRGWFFRPLFIFYLRLVIPAIGFLFLHNTEDYRKLGVYTVKFKDASYFANCLRQNGLETTVHRPFFGCASLISGSKLLV